MAAKIKDFERLNSTEFKNAPKRDIVDTNPHAYCAPGTTRTNNTAFLLYGSGHNKQKGRSSNEANGRDFEGFGTSRYAFIRVGCTNEADGRIFETFAMLLRARWSTLALRLMGAFFMVLAMGLDGSMLMRGCSGEVYASDLIYETSLWYGCRPRDLPCLGLTVRAHAGGARPPF